MRRWRKLTDAQRKSKIIYALSLTPMTRKRLGEVVGTYKLNALVADLTADGFVCMNQSTQKLEACVDLVIV